MRLTWRSIIPSCTKKQKRKAESSAYQKRLSFSDFSNLGSTISAHDLSCSSVGSNLHVFTFNELREITNNFSATNLLGEGGFGPVHKGYIDEKLRLGLEAQTVAVKLLDLSGTQGHMEWLAEVIFLGQLRHPHLVKLIGYCWEGEHRLLVYEYMRKGSLENQLFRSARHSVALPWSTRMKIATSAAKGLAFLHEAEKPVIYRDFKASNILLDSDYTAKLSDFGLAKDGPEGDKTHVSTRIMGTHGYAAPEYVMTGHLTTMSDVYSFGVVLLEILTGKRSTDKCGPNQGKNLVEWAMPVLRDPQKLGQVIDPRLEGEFPAEGVQRAAALAYRCLSHYPKPRPTMTQVVEILENLHENNDGFDVMPVVCPVSQGNEAADMNMIEENELDEFRHSPSPGWRVRNRLGNLPSYSDGSLYSKKYRNGLKPPSRF